MNKNKTIASLIMFLFFTLLGVTLHYSNNVFADDDSFTPSASVTNSAPSFTAGPSDGSSSTSTPTNAGDNVTFSGTGTDANSDPYYLAICKENSITPSTNDAPTCGGAGEWAISAETASGTGITPITYATSAGSAESNVWYAFVCDKQSSASCSASSQGSGDSGSPFKVNHKPSYTFTSALDTGKKTSGCSFFIISSILEIYSGLSAGGT